MRPYYQDSAVTIYHGDCREVIEGEAMHDLVLTDPPYSENTHANAKTNRGNGTSRKLVNFASREEGFVRELFGLLPGICHRWVIATLEWRHACALESEPPEGLRFLRLGVWVKTNGMPQISADRPAQGWEAIGYLHNSKFKPEWKGGGKAGNYVLPVEPSALYPTQKPISLALGLIELFTDRGHSVFDPCMGSGTTLRAAKDLGRYAVGVDLSEEACEIAAKRMCQEVLSF